MSVVIQVENLSKYYRLGLIGGGTLREDLGLVGQGPQPARPPAQDRRYRPRQPRRRRTLGPARRQLPEVRSGEILGIIGRNGAGNSTLLKILSRITAPTRGQIKFKGRVGSLLAVGDTAFQKKYPQSRLQRARASTSSAAVM